MCAISARFVAPDSEIQAESLALTLIPPVPVSVLLFLILFVFAGLMDSLSFFFPSPSLYCLPTHFVNDYDHHPMRARVGSSPGGHTLCPTGEAETLNLHVSVILAGSRG